MQGDATYLITKEDGTLEPFGVNAVCTHLGCVVPWNKSLNRFACPCHGSQYDKNGKVIVFSGDWGVDFRRETIFLFCIFLSLLFMLRVTHCEGGCGECWAGCFCDT